MVGTSLRVILAMGGCKSKSRAPRTSTTRVENPLSRPSIEMRPETEEFLNRLFAFFAHRRDITAVYEQCSAEERRALEHVHLASAAAETCPSCKGAESVVRACPACVGGKFVQRAALGPRFQQQRLGGGGIVSGFEELYAAADQGRTELDAVLQLIVCAIRTETTDMQAALDEIFIRDAF